MSDEATSLAPSDPAHASDVWDVATATSALEDLSLGDSLGGSFLDAPMAMMVVSTANRIRAVNRALPSSTQSLEETQNPVQNRVVASEQLGDNLDDQKNVAAAFAPPMGWEPLGWSIT